jgi:hypothetical protein
MLQSVTRPLWEVHRHRKCQLHTPTHLARVPQAVWGSSPDIVYYAVLITLNWRARVSVTTGVCGWRGGVAIILRRRIDVDLTYRKVENALNRPFLV